MNEGETEEVRKDEDIKIRKLGKNPLTSFSEEELESEPAKVLRNNLISYKARKGCIHLRYSKNYEQYHCVSPRARQRGFLGEEWMEKCRKCHMKETKKDEFAAIRQIPHKILKKIFGI